MYIFKLNKYKKILCNLTNKYSFLQLPNTTIDVKLRKGRFLFSKYLMGVWRCKEYNFILNLFLSLNIYSGYAYDFIYNCK